MRLDDCPTEIGGWYQSGVAETTDQSCLNRFLTEVPWDEEPLNEGRIDWHQEDASTRVSLRGVIAIDNVLIDHYGKTIEDVGYFWDHGEERYKIAHDYLFANYVCTTGKHYPLYFRRFNKQQQCEADGEEFINHTELTMELVDQVCKREIPGAFTWDSYFTNARIMNHAQGKKDAQGHRRAYVGELKMNGKVIWKGSEQSIRAVAASIPEKDRKEIRRVRHAAVVFHGDVEDTEGEPSGACGDHLESALGQRTLQDLGKQSNQLGSEANAVGVAKSLDRHGDLSPGRETGTGHGRLPAS